MDGKKVSCPRCGYQWQYKGKLGFATCPNCRKLVRVRKTIDETGLGEGSARPGRPKRR